MIFEGSLFGHSQKEILAVLDKTWDLQSYYNILIAKIVKQEIPKVSSFTASKPPNL